jgi:hypothetical protein
MASHTTSSGSAEPNSKDSFVDSLGFGPSATGSGDVPKTVSWNGKENIRFIDCIGHQKKVRRHKRMAEEKVYTSRVTELVKNFADQKAELSKKNARLEEIMEEKNARIADLEQMVFGLQLAAAKSSFRSGSDADKMNTSGSSTGSDVKVGDTSPQ